MKIDKNKDICFSCINLLSGCIKARSHTSDCSDYHERTSNAFLKTDLKYFVLCGHDVKDCYIEIDQKLYTINIFIFGKIYDKTFLEKEIDKHVPVGLLTNYIYFIDIDEFMEYYKKREN